MFFLIYAYFFFTKCKTKSFETIAKTTHCVSAVCLFFKLEGKRFSVENDLPKPIKTCDSTKTFFYLMHNNTLKFVITVPKLNGNLCPSQGF